MLVPWSTQGSILGLLGIVPGHAPFHGQGKRILRVAPFPRIEVFTEFVFMLHYLPAGMRWASGTRYTQICDSCPGLTLTRHAWIGSVL